QPERHQHHHVERCPLDRLPEDRVLKERLGVVIQPDEARRAQHAVFGQAQVRRREERANDEQEQPEPRSRYAGLSRTFWTAALTLSKMSPSGFAWPIQSASKPCCIVSDASLPR